MERKKYIAASTIVTDEIHFPGRREAVTVPGGAGIYALCGMKLFTDDVLPVPGGGEDFKSLFGSWFSRNGIPMEGIRISTEKTPLNIIRYDEDGGRTETPRYGENHYHEVEVKPEYLETVFPHAKGVYIFRNSERSFWEPVLRMKHMSGVPVMWEIAADAAYPENMKAVRTLAEEVEILSINETEAAALTGLGPEYAAEELLSWKVPLIFLRRGSRGCSMFSGGFREDIPSAAVTDVVDPTGCGNSSSGAVLVGWCEGRAPRECAWMGNMAAAMCIRQYGVPEIISPEMRRRAEETVRKESR